jgi:hypothetical protein
VTATSADNFFVLDGAEVTIVNFTDRALTINNLTISGGANTILNSNNTASNVIVEKFNINGSFKGSFKRLGAGNIHLLNTTMAEIDITEVEGSSSVGGLFLGYGAKAKLTANTKLYNLLLIVAAGNLKLDGKTLTAHDLVVSGSVTGGGTSSLILLAQGTNKLRGGAQIYMDLTTPGTTNYLQRFEVANANSDLTFNSDTYIYTPMEVRDLILGVRKSNSYFRLDNNNTNGAIKITGSFYSSGNGISTNTVEASVVTFADNTDIYIPNQNTKLVFTSGSNIRSKVIIGNNVKLNITEIVNPSAATNNTVVNGAVTGSFVLGTVPTSAQGKVTLSGSTSAITLAIPPATLPLDFKSFAYKSLNTGVLLSWSTANERNVEKFIIEKSSNGVDFVQILDRKSFGQGAFNYEFLDQTPSVGVNYYRLKGIDFDGKETEYPQVLAINYKLSNNVQVKVFPNPTAREINVSIPSEFGKTADVSILDISGKTLHTEKLKLLQGLANHKLNNTQLPAGTYIIKVKGEQKSESLKVLVK